MSKIYESIYVSTAYTTKTFNIHGFLECIFGVMNWELSRNELQHAPNKSPLDLGAKNPSKSKFLFSLPCAFQKHYYSLVKTNIFEINSLIQLPSMSEELVDPVLNISFYFLKN